MGQERNKRRPLGTGHRRQPGDAVPQVPEPDAFRDRPDRAGIVPAPPAATRNPYLRPIVCALLLLAVGLVFGQTVGHAFVNLDDGPYVFENPHVSRGLTARGIAWAFVDNGSALWVPVTWLSLLLDGQLYGLNAGGYHLSNVLLHAATTVLLVLVLGSMTGRAWPSALAAALFAIHPLRVESVAWVTERKDVLSGLFFVLTLAAYGGYVRHRFSLIRYLTVMALFALGLMAKPMLVTLPFVLLLLDYWPLRRMSASRCLNRTPSHGNEGAFSDNARFSKTELGHFSFPWRLVLEKVPLLALAALSCIVTLSVQGEALGSVEQCPLWWRISHALIAYVTYLAEFFYPVSLVAVYPHPSLLWSPWKTLAALLILAAITAAAWLGRRRCPYFLVGWLWYVGMLAPVIGLVQVGVQTMADRFTYLPQVGLGIALAWAAADGCRSWSRHGGLCGVASAVVLAVLMGSAWRQTAFWRDSETLWNHALTCIPRNEAAHDILGLALADQGRFDEAKAHYQQALEILPGYVGAHLNFGLALESQGRIDEAVGHYRQALQIQPDYAEAHNNLGLALAGQGRLEEAVTHCRQAVRIQPKFAEAHNSLATVLAQAGKFDEAAAHFKRALQLRPDYAGAHHNLGVALAGRGRLDEAMAQFREALEIRPGDAEAHFQLAVALDSRERFAEALAGRSKGDAALFSGKERRRKEKELRPVLTPQNPTAETAPEDWHDETVLSRLIRSLIVPKQTWPTRPTYLP